MSVTSTPAVPARESRPPIQVKVNINPHNIFGKSGACVDVPHVRIRKGDEKVTSVLLHNATNDKAWFWFPNGHKVFTGGKEKFLKLIEIRKDDSLTLDVLESLQEGDYHYHVYCEAVEDCAHGNSEPRVSVP